MADTLSLDLVYFKLEIEDAFPIKGRNIIVVAGRVACGEIHDKSDVLIVDSAGSILHATKIIDLDWFGRHRYSEHVTADAGRNVGIIFDSTVKEHLIKGNYIVIE